MIVKILGILDVLTGISIILFNYDLLPVKIVFAVMIYLLVKGIAFRGDVASFIDLGIFVYMILMFISPLTIVSFIVAIYMFQKGIVSFL